MRRALALARRAYGSTSPNPMVGAVLVKGGKIIGIGWHRQAGGPHAEIEALLDAERRGCPPRGATLFVTLEPCCTHGRTPPCTQALIAAGIRRVVVAATDPNPKHAGRGFRILNRAGIAVELFGVPRSRDARHRRRPNRLMEGMQAVTDECARLNESFNHWIVDHTPFVTVKAAMTLDGKIATAGGESKWITGATARALGMKLRQGADAILVGVNTVLADDPSLTFRAGGTQARQSQKSLRRFILDSHARTPLTAKVVTDGFATKTTIVATRAAPGARIAALAKHVSVMIAPDRAGRVDLRWLLRRLGRENVTSLLVEGGGEVNASFLEHRLAHRVAFFYAPRILGGRSAHRAVAGDGAGMLSRAPGLRDLEFRKVGGDLFLTGLVDWKPFHK